MSGEKKYLIWIVPMVRDRLLRRFPTAPMKEILQLVRERLSTRAKEGRPAPFPYPSGVLLLTIEEDTTLGKYRITPLYEIKGDDNAVDVLDVGMVRLENDA